MQKLFYFNPLQSPMDSGNYIQGSIQTQYYGPAKLWRILLLVFGFVFMFASAAEAQKPAASLEQIRNGSASNPTNPAQWQNGNAGNQTAHYVEGHSIGYRTLLTGLPVGTPVTLTLGYDITHSSKNAIDFLTHYDRLQPHGQFFHTQETVDPRIGTSFEGLSVVPSTREIPRPYGASAVTPAGSAYDAIATAKRMMTMWGGTITNIAYVTPFANTSLSQAEQQITVTFTATSSSAVLAWGGHIASRLDWVSTTPGEILSAGGISGSPYHMRLIGWSIGNLGQQDRSLSAAAVVAPPECTLTGATAVCAGSSNTYTTTVVADSYAWTLTNSGGATAVFNPAPTSTSTSVTVEAGTNAGSYTVSLVTTRNGISSTDICQVVATVYNPATNNVTDRIHCTGASGAAITFSSPTAGATFAWTSTHDVGFGLSGTSNISAYTATNTTNAPIVATVSVIATANGCPGPTETFTVTVNPSPATNNVTDRIHCTGASGAAITFSSPTAGATFAWTSTHDVGFGLSGTSNISAYTATNTTNAPIVATVSVIATANGCPGPTETFTVTVNPSPATNNVTDRIHCTGASGAAITFSSPTAGATFAWTSTHDVGFGLSGTSNISAYTATNTTNAPIVATVSVIATANGCPGPTETFTVTVNPSPATNNVTDRIHCTGASGAAITFSSPTAGATFAWTSTHDVGFGLSGTSNISAYTATNTTNAPIVATVSVIATANGCPGPTETFTVTVNPSPATNNVTDRIHCTGASGAAITFSSPTAGATFAWTSTHDVGFGLSGTSNISAYTATNTTNAPIVATVSVIATANGCPGPTETFTVTVNNEPLKPSVDYNPPACDDEYFSITLNSPIAQGKYYIYDKNGVIISGITINNVTVANPYQVTNTPPTSITFGHIRAGSGFKVVVESSSGCTSDPKDCGEPDAVGTQGIQSIPTSKAPETKVASTEDTKMKVYPIPFSDRTTIEFKSGKDEDYVINLYNLEGKMVRQLKAGKAKAGEITRVEVDGRDMAETMYLARKESKSGVSTIKLLKRR